MGEHEQVRAAPALQLNFLQHVFTILKLHGHAAIDKFNLDILWLKDESLEDSANLPDPDMIGTQFERILDSKRR